MMKNLRDLKNSLASKIVILREDFNVPVVKGEIADYSKIERSLATIKFLRECGAKVVLISHFGRPNGVIDLQFSLSFLVSELERMLGAQVLFSYACIGDEVKQMIRNLDSCGVLLLENIRFYKGELENDQSFALNLAELGDIYVNDAFSCSHRSHASVVGLARLLPSYPGFLFEKEIEGLRIIERSGKEESIAIIGGKKISTKFNLISSLRERASKIVVVGAMANTCLKAAGYEIGRSFYEPELLAEASAISQMREVFIPTDFVCYDSRSGRWRLAGLDNIAESEEILDIGPSSCFEICSRIASSSLVLWNGPLGVFEDDRFAVATQTVARFIAGQTAASNLLSVVGGGDTISALNLFQMTEYMSYASTSGGAFLEWLEGKSLPGVLALGSV